MDAIVANQKLEGNVTRSQTSITNSMGESLVVETTSIAAIAWLNNQNTYGKQITLAINWLVAAVKSGGMYGSTQGTILALKAITSYMQNFASINGQGNFVLSLND